MIYAKIEKIFLKILPNFFFCVVDLDVIQAEYYEFHIIKNHSLRYHRVLLKSNEILKREKSQ